MLDIKKDMSAWHSAEKKLTNCQIFREGCEATSATTNKTYSLKT